MWVVGAEQAPDNEPAITVSLHMLVTDTKVLAPLSGRHILLYSIQVSIEWVTLVTRLSTLVLSIALTGPDVPPT